LSRQRQQRRAGDLRDFRDVRVSQTGGKCDDLVRPLCRDDPELRQMCADRVEDHRALQKKLRRSAVLDVLGKLEPCLIGMEACATSHFWAREIAALGHDVRLIPPAYVKPYVKRQKNDAADAEAICEAVARPNMRFVPAKTAEQQSVLVLHRSRDLLMRQDDGTIGVNAMKLKDGLGDIDPECCNLHEDDSFPCLVHDSTSLAHCDAVGVEPSTASDQCEPVSARAAELTLVRRRGRATRRERRRGWP
jgi:Transposase